MKELRAHIIGAMPKTRVVAAPDEAAVQEPTTRPIRLFGKMFDARGAWAAPHSATGAHWRARRSSIRWTPRR